MSLGDKFKQARRLLNLTQSEMGEGIGIPQKVVSLVENNNRDTIPTEYFHFLEKNGIDLNSIFNIDSKVVFIEDYSTKLVAEPSMEYKKKEQLSLKTLDKRINELECIITAIRLKFEVDSEIEETINSLKKKNLTKKS